jgi:hypothetical protein
MFDDPQIIEPMAAAAAFQMFTRPVNVLGLPIMLHTDGTQKAGM